MEQLMQLDQIAAAARARVARQKKRIPLGALRRQAEALPRPPRFLPPCDDIAFICELKRASPSKGMIAADFPYLQIARDYEQAGAAAISVLTEPDFFQGSNVYLNEIATFANFPILRKDFTVDPYQIYEAKALGASAVLLICALLDESALREYLALVRLLGLCALVETHNEQEVKQAAAAGASIIGVNNRDLQSFQVDLRTCERLRPFLPKECTFVAESGIRTAADVAYLRGLGAHAVLVGETLMRAPDKRAKLEELRGQCNPTKRGAG
jgi:indole-3-glycerol phosphate synthase